MCGICGYVGDHRAELLEPMAMAMAHRGPDDMGTWHDASLGVGLAHRRLSIIDLSAAGHQPMCNEDGTIWISYNGEIYNFQEIRDRLISRGHQFRSRTDTEVLVHLYEEDGLDLLRHLNGIFSFAIWDGRKRQLMLARDHAGIKPLYYWCNGSRLFFASEIKSLLRIPGIPRELSLESLSEYLAYLWVPGDKTLLAGISKVEPGHYLLWKDGKIQTKQWFELAYEPDESVSESDWAERVHETFMRTTRRQMVSDVPLGGFLSGGLDSSSIVACMRESFPDREIRCYTVYVDPEQQNTEGMAPDYPYAKKVAEDLGIQLKTVDVKPDVVALLPKMVYHLDEPDADPAIFPSYLISKLAREDGTLVLLSGTGGDEVFFGYRSHVAYRQYELLDRFPRWLPMAVLNASAWAGTRLLGADRAIPRRLAKFRNALRRDGVERHLAIVDWSSPAVRRSLLGDRLAMADYPGAGMRKYFDSFVGRGELNRHSHMLIQTFLSAHNFLYTDKTSMAASIEARVPFMDVELMQLCARIPERYKLAGRVTKSILKKAMSPYLPAEVVHRSKTGFGAPLREWISGDLRPVVNDLLSPARIRQRGLFDPKAVQQVLDDKEANRADHSYLIYALLTLEVWQQTFIDRPAVEVRM